MNEEIQPTQEDAATRQEVLENESSNETKWIPNPDYEKASHVCIYHRGIIHHVPKECAEEFQAKLKKQDEEFQKAIQGGKEQGPTWIWKRA